MEYVPWLRLPVVSPVNCSEVSSVPLMYRAAVPAVELFRLYVKAKWVH